MTLAVQKFGLNSPGFSYFKKVHSARGLQRKHHGDVAKLSKYGKEIERI
jgi:hypothetical protein